MDLEQRAKELLERASRLDEADRALFLDRECGSDDKLRRLVEALLAGDDETVNVSEVVSRPTPPPPPPVPVAGSREFSAGEIFADRYRIVSLLGRGAMGEVYRAHDTVLDVPVAIKFVLGFRPDFRDRLLKEVRLSRAITHPAVCRVFDVGKDGDRLYFTMEYIDGEDLATLLARIGRLPSDKVIDIAKQICTGLAAAHAKGVIHRDLKPANIMIDGAGKVRITDFGIAVTKEDDERDGIAGTPAYMAPEQLNPDVEVGPRADIYATGLILHELLTGTKVFQESGFTNVFRAKMRTTPAPPSSMVEGVDPQLERVVLRAVERAPEDRPSSALAMAAELPGGDPLAMAVEAGALADPRVVAAATVDRPFKRSSPWWLMGALIVLLAGVVALTGPSAIFEGADRIKAPEVLEDRSERLLSELDLSERGGESVSGFLDNVAAADPVNRVLFWYRIEAPRPVPDFVARAFDDGGMMAVLDSSEAFTSEPTFLMIDPIGNLVYLNAGTVFGSKVGGPAIDQETFDWSRLLEAAGLNGVALSPVTDAVLPVASDRRAVWTSDGSEIDGATIRVEAAAYNNLPVYFSAETIDRGSAARHRQMARKMWLERWVRTPLYFIVVLVALGLGVHSMIHERSDLRGAGVLAAVVLVVGLLAALFSAGRAEHPLSTSTMTLLGNIVDIALGSLAVGLMYIGLEPLVRRHRPQSLVAWNRMLTGNVVNRAVGYSLLTGALAGSLWALATELDRIAVSQLNLGLNWGFLGADRLNAALNLGTLASSALNEVEGAISGGLLAAVLYVLLRRWIKIRWAAWAVFVGFVAVFVGIDAGAHMPLSIATLGVAGGVLMLYLMVRSGLLTLVAALFSMGVLTAFPITMVRRVWYAQGGYFAIGLVLMLGLVGAVLVVGGRAVERWTHRPITDR